MSKFTYFKETKHAMTLKDSALNEISHGNEGSIKINRTSLSK